MATIVFQDQANAVAAAFSTQTGNNVAYAGKMLPRDKAAVQPVTKDATNNPSLITIGGIQLPQDTLIYIDGQKLIAKSNILDGVPVTQRISRKATEIEFEGTFRATVNNKNVFAQDLLNEFWTSVFYPDTVLKVVNTALNKIGISQLVIESFNPATVRGSTNIPFKLKAYENILGSSITIP